VTHAASRNISFTPMPAVPRAAAAIKAGALTVAVIGTTSSTLPGANSKPLAYPARLEAVLQRNYRM